VTWINLAEDWIHWRDVVNMLKKLSCCVKSAIYWPNIYRLLKK